MLSLVIPVYNNEPNLDGLLAELAELRRELADTMEVIFVVDGSPDRSLEILRERLPAAPFPSRLIALSRNFGSFAAIAAGLEAGGGDHFAVLAADLQEPPELIVEFCRVLARGEADVVFGCRAGRSDPWLSEMASHLFWWVYRVFVLPEMPRGGVDVFGCTRQVRDWVLRCPEANTNLIALLFWVGFRRRYTSYRRRARAEGRSAWTFRKKVQYSIDSIFNFTDLPAQLLMWVGISGIGFALLCAAVLGVLRLSGEVAIPGYSAVVLAVIFFGGVTSLGLGIIGQYLWMTLQNARRRPNYIVASAERFREQSERPAVTAPQEETHFFGQ
jgi:glycosyltransferase involved in cell wall biosynthesis